MSKRILVSWIGNTDLRAFACDVSAAKAERIMRVAGGQLAGEADGNGPLKTLVEQRDFAEVHLLSDFDPTVIKQFALWLGGKPKLHHVTLKNPSDYPSILQAVRPVMAQVSHSSSDLALHLSPGTPAMAAMWILLGKSQYPATLYQTYNGTVSEAEIPFDIAVDVLPEFLKSPDRFWQHLSDRAPGELFGFEHIIGESDAIKAAVGRAQRAAIHDVPVLILGESGTGKEMFAEAIHRASHRRDKPFLMVNCAAMPSQLLESELFGHTKGAFTDASKDKAGLFEQANGGTLFLDEVGECTLEMQAKLLRVLQPPHDKGPCDRVFRRVGASKDICSDVRIVAATNRDLATRSKAGDFREDLIYRLATITVKLPPLRERASDTGLLAEALLVSINQQFQRQHGVDYQHKSLSADAKKFVSQQVWPGNVRQLRNVLVQASVMSVDSQLTATDLTAAIADFPGMEPAANIDPPIGNGFDIEEFLQDIRVRFIRRAMTEANGKVTHAARLLGMSNYQTLSQQMERMKIDQEL